MTIELECEVELDEGIYCDFIGEVEADRSAGLITANCPKCNYQHDWDDDSGTNPEEL